MLLSRRSALCRRFREELPVCATRNGLVGKAIREYVVTDVLDYFTQDSPTEATYSETTFFTSDLNFDIPNQAQTAEIWISLKGGISQEQDTSPCNTCGGAGARDCPCIDAGLGMMYKVTLNLSDFCGTGASRIRLDYIGGPIVPSVDGLDGDIFIYSIVLEQDVDLDSTYETSYGTIYISNGTDSVANICGCIGSPPDCGISVPGSPGVPGDLEDDLVLPDGSIETIGSITSSIIEYTDPNSFVNDIENSTSIDINPNADFGVLELDCQASLVNPTELILIRFS